MSEMEALAVIEPAKVEQIQAKSGRNLNKRERLFVAAYIKSGNSTQAAIAAGYTEASASNAGYRLLKRDEIQLQVAQGIDKLAKLQGFTTDYVLENLKQLQEAETTRPADKIRCLELIGKYLNMWAQEDKANLEVKIVVERIG